jgi:hypothetical protein
VAVAFGTVYGWSHAVAVAETARQTRELFGVIVDITQARANIGRFHRVDLHHPGWRGVSKKQHSGEISLSSP